MYVGISRQKARRAQIERNAPSQIFEPSSVDYRFPDIQARSHVCIRQNACMVKRRSQIDLATPFNGRAAANDDARPNLGVGTNVARRLNLNAGIERGGRVDPDVLA